MKIKTIEASGSNEQQDGYTMLKRWRGLRYVAEITEDEDERQCTIELQKKVDAMLNPQLTDASTIKWDIPQDHSVRVSGHDKVLTIRTVPTIDYKAKEKAEADIDNATTIADLEFYADAAERYGLMDLYNQKLSSLK